MCFEYQPERVVRAEPDHALEEIRRLFERYRATGRREADATAEAPDEASPVAQEDEPALTAR